MGFVKGKSGNPKGKQPGTLNLVTADVRETIKAALSGITGDQLATRLKQLDHKDFIDAYTKLAEFVTPKLARTALAADDADTGRVTVTLNLGGPPKDAD